MILKLFTNETNISELVYLFILLESKETDSQD